MNPPPGDSRPTTGSHNLYRLDEVDKSILSSYPLNHPHPLPLAGLAMGIAPWDVRHDLLTLCQAVPGLRVTELHRSIDVQTEARGKYLAWLEAGKPNRSNPRFDRATMKSDFVAIPGRSMHNAGRAIDVDLNTLAKVFGLQYLDEFWPIARAHGFTPVIADPREDASESWHFDHYGPWHRLRDRHGHETAAFAACLSVGCAGSWQAPARVVQAHLLRLGQEIGEIDGIIGPRTRMAVAAVGLGQIPSVGDYRNIISGLEGL